MERVAVAGAAMGSASLRLRSALPLVAVAGAFALLFGATVLELLADWRTSAEYGHGLLLLPVAGFLAWRSRTEGGRAAPGWGLALLAGSVALFLIGALAAEHFTRRVAILGAVAGLAVYYRGREQLRAWWLPFGLIALAIPLPEIVLKSLTLPLQLLASRIAVTLLELRYVPASLSGNIILLPGQELFVAEACSGLRSLSALLALTLLVGGTLERSPWSRAALLLLAVPLALATNALRVFATGFAAHYAGPEFTQGAWHTAMGVLVFALPLAVLLAVALGLRRAGG